MKFPFSLCHLSQIHYSQRQVVVYHRGIPAMSSLETGKSLIFNRMDIFVFRIWLLR